MHTLTSSQQALQDLKFAPRAIGALQYLLHLREEESGTTFQMIGYGVQSGSYITISRTFPLYENLYYYLRVFELPSGSLSPTMSAIDAPIGGGVDPYVSKTTREANSLLASYVSDDEILGELYRGKVFCTNSSDLQNFSIYDSNPMTKQPLDTTKQWTTI